MKTVFKYLFALCILLLIGDNQLSAHTTAESTFPTLVENQQIWGNSDKEFIGLEQNVNTKSLLPTTVEIPSLEVSEFAAEERYSTNLAYGTNFVAFYKSLTSPHYFHNNSLRPIIKKYLSFSSCRRYLLFEVFRI